MAQMRIGSRGISPNVRPTGFTPAQSPNLGPGIGPALQGLGVAVGQYAQWQAQKKQQEDERAAELAFTRRSGEIEREVLDRQRNAPEAATGFTDEIGTFLEQQREEFLAELPDNPAIRSHYETMFETLKQNGTTSAFTFEYQRTNDFFVRTERERFSEAQTRLYEDPDLFELETAEMEERIRSSTLSAPEQEALIAEGRTALIATAYQQMAETAIQSNQPVRDPAAGGLAPVAPGLTAPQAGVLSAIASKESRGEYNVIAGDVYFDDYTDHPRITGPLGTSAAGKYQFTAGTWDWMTDLMRKDGILISDFSPVSQDRVALYYAEFTWRDYAKDRGLGAVSFDQATTDPNYTSHLRQALQGHDGFVWEGLKNVTDEQFGAMLRGGTVASEQPTYVRPEPEGFDWAAHTEAGALRPDAITSLDPNFRGGLAQLISNAPPELREGISLYSGFRSAETQAGIIADNIERFVPNSRAEWEADVAEVGAEAAGEKWRDRLRAAGMTAEYGMPGTSNHQHGNAADLRFNGKRLGEPGTEAAVEWLHANAEQFGLQFRLGNEPWHIEDSGTRAAPTSTGGEYNPIPDAVTDPRFADLPFDQRLELTQAAQASVRTSLQEAAARQREAEVATHQSLANAFENGEPGSYEAINDALESNLIRDLGLRDDLRSRITKVDEDQVTMANVASLIQQGAKMSADDEKDMMTFYEQSGILTGFRTGDPGAMRTVIDATNRTGYLPAPMLGVLTAQLGSTDVQQATYAAEAIAQIYRANPQAFSANATTEQVKMATQLALIQDTSNTQAEMLERQRFMSDPATYEERRRLGEEAAKNAVELDIDNILTDDWFGNTATMPVSPVMQERLRGQYQGLYQEGYVRFRGDDDLAQAYAKQMIQNNWALDPLSGGLMEFSPLANGANVPVLGDAGKDWVAAAVREQIETTLGSLPENAVISLQPDMETRRQFAQSLPPTYPFAVYITDENGGQMIDVPMVEDENGRLVPARVSAVPTGGQLAQRDYDLSIKELNGQIEAYERQNRAEESARHMPGNYLSPEESADLQRAIRRRDYLEAIGPEAYARERQGLPGPNPNTRLPAEAQPTSAGAAFTATGMEALPEAAPPPEPTAAPSAPVETAPETEVRETLFRTLGEMAQQLPEGNTELDVLREQVLNAATREELISAANMMLTSLGNLPASQEVMELRGRLNQILRGAQ